jgi:putative membrane protein
MNFSFFTLVMHWVVSALALALTAALVPGFRIGGFGTALIAALLIGVVNYFLWPLLFFLTLPFTVITFGLFIFVVDAIILRICAAMMTDFSIKGWWSAILGAILLSLSSSFLHWLFV